VSSSIDLIYDRLVAEEKLRSGTKYERRAALAFRELTGRATVHDLRLRGSSGVPHQIDVVVGDDAKRVLIETKDYDKVVDLPVVRNFWGVVDDLRPDEAFMLTTVGFSDNARRYASAKGIRLAVLRPPLDEGWEGFVRRIVLDVTVTGQAGPANIRWHVHPEDHHKLEGDRCALD
jgi:hypothetical protein